MRILFLSRWFPFPPNNGARVRVFNLIKALAAVHQVDLLSFEEEPVAEESRAVMGRYCGFVKTVEYHRFRPMRLQALLGLLSSTPRFLVDTFSAEMQSLAQQAVVEQQYDLVIASQIDMAPYAAALSTLPRMFEELELATQYDEYMQQKNPVKRLRYGMMWRKHAQFLPQLMRAFRVCTVVSEPECRLATSIVRGHTPIAVIPNGVDVASYPPLSSYGPPERDTLIYTGALTYSANFDAIAYFLAEVFPLIKARRPHVRLYVTGALDGVPVTSLPQDDAVVYTGYLDDVRPRLATCWASVVPLRRGGGTRVKILESLVLGTPVVSTSKGAQGLALTQGADLLVADEPSSFADAVVHLLGDEDMRRRLVQNGSATVRAKYDWQIIGKDFCALVEKAATDGAMRPTVGAFREN
jgi:glycosyltransferase involved in cell wall biosynthesis